MRGRQVVQEWTAVAKVLYRRSLGNPVDVHEVCRDVGIANPSTSFVADLQSNATSTPGNAETRLEKAEIRLEKSRLAWTPSSALHGTI